MYNIRRFTPMKIYETQRNAVPLVPLETEQTSVGGLPFNSFIGNSCP